jgi:hypothetical protein
MNEPLLFIRRVRRSLVPVANPAPVPAICPHCGKSLAEPVVINIAEPAREDGGSATGNRPTTETEPVKISKPKKGA